MRKKSSSQHLSLKAHLYDASINLMATKLRTFLALLGILVGAASVVAMISGGELMAHQVLLQFKNLGTNLIAVTVNDTPEDSDASTKQALSIDTAKNIKTASSAIEEIAPYANLYMPIFYQGHQYQGGIIGADSQLQSVMNIELQTGRFISFLDQLDYYCVVGHDLYQKVFRATGKNPIGQQIKIQGNFFTIVGALKARPDNAFFFADLNHAVIVPLSTALTLNKYAKINSIVLRFRKNTNIKQLEQNITHYINQNAPGKQLYYQSPEQMIASMKQQQQILTLFLGFIGAISLIVGGIGVMNIMLVSVTERKREIGVRMALGATRRDIQLMFLIEAIMLSLIGGILGVLLGVLISYIIALIKSWSFTLLLMPPAIGFSISVLVGVFFGFYPAFKASKLNPIECLRSE